jgi:3'-5' exoribonuclease
MSGTQENSPTSIPKETAHRVDRLSRGDRVQQVFLVQNSNFKQTRNSNFFIQAELRDRTGSVKAIRWEADRALFESFGADDFVRVTGRVEEFQQHPQIIIDKIEKVTDGEVDLEAFLPVSEFDIPTMEAELREFIAGVQNPHIRQLLDAFLADDEASMGLRRCPAGKALHHAAVGGLLEHIVSLARAASLICQNYPRLDRDVLLAGVVLHDIGKIRELSYSRNFKYTTIGQLVGHIGLGIAWVQDKARGIPDFPESLLEHLLHLIASHHGEPEFGAVKAPMTEEALTLHHLDNLDAKLDIYKRVEREQQLGQSGGERWSVYHPAMGRRLYFPE